MSDGNKTEKPTQKRKDDSRKKGQVAKSQEVTSGFVLLTCFAFIWGTWEQAYKQMEQMFDITVLAMNQPFDIAFNKVWQACSFTFGHIILLLMGALILAAIAGGLIQIGVLFVSEPVKPKLNNLSPKKYVQKVFSIKGIYTLVMSIVKTVVVFTIIYVLIKANFRDMMKLYFAPADMVWPFTTHLVWQVAMFCAVGFVAFAVFDYIFQLQMHTKQLMMSKDEIKKEFKEMEGDPEIKSKRKQLHEEMAMSDAGAQVRKSSVLVTNPIHIAVALRYEEGETDLPVIMAKGKGLIARHMIEVAKEEGIPIMQNIPLAHNLYDQGQEMDYIPSELIEPVAEVIAWVAEIGRQRS